MGQATRALPLFIRAADCVNHVTIFSLMRLAKYWEHYILLLERLGAPAAESLELRINRAVMIVMTSSTILAGTIWGILYLAYNEPLAGAIPLTYAALSILNIAAFLKFHQHLKVVNLIQLCLLLLLPFLLMYALGGFVNSSAVIIWSFMTPLAALLLFDRKSAAYWFVAYLVLGILSGLLEPSTPVATNLPWSVVVFFFVLNVSAPLLVTFWLLYSFVGERDQAYQLLGLEQEKSERLLLNVLPAVIADRLKNKKQQIAEHFDEVTVLFADVVGFTPMSAGMTPIETVDILNEIFSHFDLLAEKFEVEKIRTIGDGYMVAAGVPKPMTNHAHAIAQMAIEMNAYIKKTYTGEQTIQIRVGINSGSTVAGIIGTSKFHYDLWGDMVNVAARMESHGMPGKIQIAEGTYMRIKDQLDCVSRGLISIKGKGELETWFLQELIQ
jgi:guanylate cyclase